MFMILSIVDVHVHILYLQMCLGIEKRLHGMHVSVHLCGLYLHLKLILISY